MPSLPTKNSSNHVAVVGASLTAYITALYLASKGFNCYLLGRKQKKQDYRSTALMMPAIEILQYLNLWQILSSKAMPLKKLVLIDATERLFRSPTIQFYSHEIGLSQFGYNISNIFLYSVLADLINNTANIQVLDSNVIDCQYQSTSAHLTLDNQQIIKADYVIGADGRNSIVRNSLHIATQTTKLEQIALVFAIKHQQNNQFGSTEFHYPTGPLTIVPMTEYSSNVIWVVSKAQSEQLLKSEPEAVVEQLQQALFYFLGELEITSALQSWPLMSLRADRLADKNAFLVGESAHILPPLGAQGLNLTIRDIVALAEILEAHYQEPAIAIEKYNQKRKLDVYSRVNFIQELNNSLIKNSMFLQLLKTIGLDTVKSVPAVKRWLMSELMSPGLGWKKIFSK